MPDWDVYSQAAFLSARRALRKKARRTPMMRSQSLSALAGCELSFKCENFQKGGAFKFRGAYFMTSVLSAKERSRGLITYSSGNHAQAVAIAAKMFGVPAVIVMPEDASGVKLAATRASGADILQHGLTPQERQAFATGLAKERSLTMIPPYEDPRILLGQGTVLLEILEREIDVEVVLVPVGGGGLLGGICAAAREFRPALEIYGVEPEKADDWARSFAAGRIERIESAKTIADGLRSLEPGKIPFPIVKEIAKGILTVSEDEIRRAMLLLLTRAKLVAEPSGAVSFAGAIAHASRFRGRKVVAILSGGNVEPAMLATLEAHP